MWTFQRYRSWLQNRKKWHLPSEPAEAPDSEPAGEVPNLPPLPRTNKNRARSLPRRKNRRLQHGGRIRNRTRRRRLGKDFENQRIVRFSKEISKKMKGPLVLSCEIGPPLRHEVGRGLGVGLRAQGAKLQFLSGDLFLKITPVDSPHGKIIAPSLCDRTAA